MLGAYLLYTALAVSFVTSSMFITALAPNALAITIIEQTAGVRISWLQWFIGFAPIGATLLVLTPAVLYVIYPPSIRTAPEVPRWAAGELRAMGPMSRQRSDALRARRIGARVVDWRQPTTSIPR